MVDRAPVFDKIVKEYLVQVERIEERGKVAAALGIAAETDGYDIPYFGRTHTVSCDGIADQDGKAVHHAVAVILCKYLLLCPVFPSNDTRLVTYKDFADAAPFVQGFGQTAERTIASAFENALPDLEKNCLDMGGRFVDTGVSCQLSARFDALPRVPLFLLFNDADEDFPAQATLLFQKNAASYLDMECLAMIGASLAHRLRGK